VKKLKKISIVIPIFNTDEYLSDCLNSILNQTYKNIEVILVNNASTDKSYEIISKFNKEYEIFKLYNYSKKQNVGAARNYGIKKVTGDYIYFLDSDDFLEIDTLELLVENINDYPLIKGVQRKTRKTRDELIKYQLEKELENQLTKENNEIVQDENNDELDEYEPSLNIRYYKEDRYKLFRNRSILNYLIKKSIIDKYNLSFDEEVQNYSDISFLLPLYLNITDIPYVPKSTYYKKFRYDPFYKPQLSQLPRIDRTISFLTLYLKLKHNYTNIREASYFLDKNLIAFFKSQIRLIYKNNKNIEPIFSLLSKSLSKIDKNNFKGTGLIIRNDIKIIKKNNLDKFYKYNLRQQRLKLIFKAISSRKNLYFRIYKTIFINMSVKNIVLFSSFSGKGFSDNPKYIYNYMINNNYNYTYVWIVDNKNIKIPGNPIKVKNKSLKYYYYLARSKYWVDNSRKHNNVFKRDETVYLQTWHGTPLKKLALDMKEVYMPKTNGVKYKRNFVKETSKWDYLVSPNSYSTEIFKRAFKFENKMLEFGYPRNDILYSLNNEKDINIIKEKLNIPKNKKVILYAPTWRDNEFVEKGVYKFTLSLNIEKLKKELENEYVLILRMHYLIAENLDIEGYDDFVYNLSSYSDISELYLISNILITDYSSVFFDYANLKRPILFFTYDYDNYKDTLRGFYFDMEKNVPGPLLKTSEEIIDSIKNIKTITNKYKKRYDEFYEQYCNWDNGLASENIVKEIFKNDN
jgi:CDP-glycerol glycerophosphotransferase